MEHLDTTMETSAITVKHCEFSVQYGVSRVSIVTPQWSTVIPQLSM